MTTRNDQAATRELSDDDLELVAGGYGSSDYGGSYDEDGAILVFGGRWDAGDDRDGSNDIFVSDGSLPDWSLLYFEDQNEYYGGNDGGMGGPDEEISPEAAGNGMTAAEAAGAIERIDGVRAALQDILHRYGPGTMADLNGRLVPIDDLLTNLGRLATVLQAGTLVAAIHVGDAGLADAIGFVFGMTLGAAAMEAGSGFFVAAGIAYVGGHVITGIAGQIGVAYNGVTEQVDIVIDEFVQQNHVPTESNNPYDFYRGLFGIPNPWRLDSPEP